MVALDRVDLDVFPGEILGLVGENGAGKSTLMKMMVGLVQPDGGSITLGGAPVVLPNPLRRGRSGASAWSSRRGASSRTSRSWRASSSATSCSSSATGSSPGAPCGRRPEQVLAQLDIHVDMEMPVADASPAAGRWWRLPGCSGSPPCTGRPNPVLILDEPTTVLNDEERATLFAILRSSSAARRWSSSPTGCRRWWRPPTASWCSRTAGAWRSSPLGRRARPDRGADGRAHVLRRSLPGARAAGSRTRRCSWGCGSWRRRRAFEPVSFSVREREIVSLVGLVGLGQGGGLPLHQRPRAACRRRGPARGHPGAGRLAQRGGARGASATSPSTGAATAWPSPCRWRRTSTSWCWTASRSAGSSTRAGRTRTPGIWIDDCQIKTPTARSLCSTLSGGNQQKTVIAKWLSSRVRAAGARPPHARRRHRREGRDLPHPPRAGAKRGWAWSMMCDTLEEDIGLWQPHAHHEGRAAGAGRWSARRRGSRARGRSSITSSSEPGRMGEQTRGRSARDGSANVAEAPGRRRPRLSPQYIPMGLLVLVGIPLRCRQPQLPSRPTTSTPSWCRGDPAVVALGQMCAVLVGGIDLSVGGLISFISACSWS